VAEGRMRVEGRQVMDRILFEGLECSANIGVPDEERAHRQKLWVDLEIDADLNRAAGTDNPAAMLDYSKVYELVTTLVEEKPRRLIEALAYEIADLILYAVPDAEAVKVRVWKKPAVLKKLTRVAAEITRKR